MKIHKLILLTTITLISLYLIQLSISKILNNENLHLSIICTFFIINVCYFLLRHKIEPWLSSINNEVINIDFISNKKFKNYSKTKKMNYAIREMKKQKYDLHNIFEISVNLISILDYEQLINSCLLAIIGQLKTTGAVILFKSEKNRQQYRSAHSKGSIKSDLNNLVLHQSNPIISYFKKKSIPINIDELDVEIEDLKTFKQNGISLIAPIIHQRKILGLIGVGKKINNKKFTDHELEIFSLLSNISSVAITNAKLYKKLELTSITDELTGLYNYRFFQQQLQDEVSRADRFKHYLSLVILDIDNFKQYNDTYGHPAGDEIIRQLSTILKNTARQSDVVSRYGGEEFCAILPEVDIKGAWHFGERLRKRIEKHDFSNKGLNSLDKVTISIGAASFPSDAKIIDDLVKKADNALYKAKNSGRNRVCLYSDTMDNS